MPIPENIEREHIFQAMIKVLQSPIPPRRNAREYAVLYSGTEYPCKLLISYGCEFANKYEFDSDNFNTYEAQAYLAAKGFNIIQL